MKEIQNMEKKQNVFLERMSHEIRTPMNSIIGLTYLSKENIDNPKQVLENLDKIEQSARFLRSFIDDILNLSLLESGRVAYNKEEVLFTQFLDGLKEEIEKQAKEKQIQFHLQTRGMLEQTYYFDAEKLREALYNVLQNAVKFTRAGGNVDFIVELLQEDSSCGTFRFEIRDNGIGMTKEFLEKAFDAFEQEEKGGTTLYGGTGLGLSISKNIIDFMGGKMDAYSTKENGTTIIVTVALDKAENKLQTLQKEQNGTYEPAYDFTGKRVLLVEDNEINIEITRNILKHKNFEVDVSLNGKEGVEQFLGKEAGYYDVILMDIRMPVLNGLEAAKMIRESDHADGRTIPIIAMTANVFEEDVKKSLEAGMNEHLSKPVNIRHMYRLLEKVISET